MLKSIYKAKINLSIKFHRMKTILWHNLFFKQAGKGCNIMKPLFITHECIILHDNIFIRWNARIEGIKEYMGKQYNPSIILHNGVSIQQNLHLTCAQSIEIGKDTAIAGNVTITDIHHPYDDIDTPIEHQDIEVTPVSIGEQCKIYNNAVILRGTTIGKHCTIGANSVLSGHFPDYCVIVGAPAKIVKRYSFEKQAWLKTDAKGNFIEK